MKTLKDYLYISDSKVNALYEQIASSGFFRSVKLGGSVTGTGATIEASTPDPNRHKKLEAVLKCLRKENQIGTIDAPKAYFDGVLRMRWGFLPGVENSQVVYFTGCSQTTVVGLGGSSFHVIDFKQRGDAIRNSFTDFIIQAVEKALKEVDDTAQAEVKFLPVGGNDDYDRELKTRLAVAWMIQTMQGQEAQLEFVARNLLWGRNSATTELPPKVLLGTPLCVAQI